MQRANSLEKPLMLGKTEAGGEGGDRGRDGWMAVWTFYHGHIYILKINHLKKFNVYNCKWAGLILGIYPKGKMG